MHVLVMGPGRSGSHYMQLMLANKLGYKTLHEDRRRFRDGKYLEDCNWEGAAGWLLESDKSALCGFPYGFMVYYMRHRVNDLHAICVHRDKDKWMYSVRNGKIGGAVSYPRGLASQEQYWELYEHLMLSVAPPVLHLTMEELNACESRVREFLGETKPDAA